MNSLANFCRVFFFLMLFGNLLAEDVAHESTSTVNIDSSHLLPDFKNVVLTEEYPVSAQVLLSTLAGSDTTFRRKLYEDHDGFDFNVGSWENGTGNLTGSEVRTIDYRQKIRNIFVPKGYFNVDIEEVLHSDQEQRYSINMSEQAEGVPFADTFATEERLNIRQTDENTCELSVSYKIKYHKENRPWGWVKGMLERTAKKTITKMYNDMDVALKEMTDVSPE